MFFNKLVVLTVVLAIAAAAPAPGYLGGYALPAATSYSSRIDVHSKPIITSYPVVTKTLVAAPVAYTLPAVSHHASYGIHETPLLTGYGYGLGHGYGGLEHHGLSHSYGYGHGW